MQASRQPRAGMLAGSVSDHGPLLALGLCAVVHACALPAAFYSEDAAQYAAMAREMFSQGSYFELKDRGLFYLDKPPLLFWLTSLSYAIFGISPAAYRVVSLIFAFLALVSVRGLGAVLYGRSV